MNPTTINSLTFTVVQVSDGGVVQPTGVTFDGQTRTATFSPAAPLGKNLVYLATITTGAMSAAGSSLASDWTWTFRTAVVELGSARTFSVLATTVTNTGPTGNTTLSGDLGVSAAITGAALLTVSGETYDGGLFLAARTDLQRAYDDVVALTATPLLNPVLDGLTLDAGIYGSSAAVSLATTLTLNGQGDPNAIFVFKCGAALGTTAATSRVVLTNGARASNVFWQVVGDVSLGANTSFAGTILGNGDVTAGAGTVIEGRALTRGLVTLASNAIGSEIPDGGRGSLTGSSGFVVNTCRVFGQLPGDGGLFLSGVKVNLASVNHSCQAPVSLIGGNTLTLEGSSALDGGQGKGAFLSDGTNIEVLSPGGGAEFAGVGPSSFSIEWADPARGDAGTMARGITGTLNLVLGDGGTIQGRFAGSYCGTY